MSEAGSLWGLFISSFLASTLLPGGSEGVLVWLHQQQAASTFSLLLVATLGNTLGGMTSWGIGYWLRRRFPLGGLEKPRQRQALRWLERHGSPLLLFAWLPVVGDPLCVAAGWLKFPWWSSALFIALGKGARYALLLWVSSQAM
ncbi:MAG: DedA family protein [Gammaproteobacteria bacterium]|nr:MAG: DedA family protein [Gammaproteobacteria bacterium]RTZ75896.1 MAG: DedA family protein [Gammaproteobacteria bacterium]